MHIIISDSEKARLLYWLAMAPAVVGGILLLFYVGQEHLWVFWPSLAWSLFSIGLGLHPRRRDYVQCLEVFDELYRYQESFQVYIDRPGDVEESLREGVK